MKSVFLFLCIMALATSSWSQAFNHRYTNDRLQEYTDSLKRTPYPYILPFLGAKVQARGFDIQRPFGVMVNTTTGYQELNIDRLSVSTDNINYVDVTDLVNFTRIRPHVNVVNVRPDIWILPFLNVSGLVGYFNSETDVWLDQPADLKFVAKNHGSLAGFGIMAAGGVGPIFFSYEYNGTWSNTEKLFNSTYTSMNGLRFGHQHKNHKRPQTAWSFWVGVESMTISPLSRGSVNLTDLTGISDTEKQNASDQLDSWYNELSPLQQNLLQPIYDKVSGWLKDDQDAILYYDFDKAVEQQWTFLTGFQYQLNKNWMLTAEGSYWNNRRRFVLSGTYRFGIK